MAGVSWLNAVGKVVKITIKENRSWWGEEWHEIEDLLIYINPLKISFEEIKKNNESSIKEIIVDEILNLNGFIESKFKDDFAERKLFIYGDSLNDIRIINVEEHRPYRPLKEETSIFPVCAAFDVLKEAYRSQNRRSDNLAYYITTIDEETIFCWVNFTTIPFEKIETLNEFEQYNSVITVTGVESFFHGDSGRKRKVKLGGIKRITLFSERNRPDR